MKKTPTPKPRTIAQNLAVTSTYTKKAIAADRVISGGVR